MSDAWLPWLYQYGVGGIVFFVTIALVLRAGALPLSVALHVAAELLEALDYAHELVHGGKHLQIVHRDVTPHNVMLSWAGGVKLVDFGIAKAIAATNASQSGAIKGKVAYMSPEQVQGKTLDGRSDVFAVGVILLPIGVYKMNKFKQWKRTHPGQAALDFRPLLSVSRDGASAGLGFRF